MYIIDHNRFRSDLRNVSYNDLTLEEKKLEHLNNNILFLYSMYDEKHKQELDFPQSFAIVSGKNAKSFTSQFQHDSLFRCDPSSGHYETLVDTLMQIVNVDPNPKFLYIFPLNHATGIFYRDGKCFLYDPNSPLVVLPVDSHNKAAMTQLVDQLTRQISSTKFSTDAHPSMTLGIDVISDEPLKGLDQLREKLPVSPPDEQCDYDQTTPLDMAIIRGHLGIVQSFLKRCPEKNINQKDKNGFTLLDWAVIRNHIDIVNVLLDCPGIDHSTVQRALVFAVVRRQVGHCRINCQTLPRNIYKSNICGKNSS